MTQIESLLMNIGSSLGGALAKPLCVQRNTMRCRTASAGAPCANPEYGFEILMMALNSVAILRCQYGGRHVWLTASHRGRKQTKSNAEAEFWALTGRQHSVDGGSA